MQTSPTPQAAPQITHEYILVVKRTLLFAQTPAWDGLNSSVFTQFAANVSAHKEFILRASAETDPTYKQIIPYMIFTVNNKIFVMQRKKEASEQRLASKMSIGIGGHIRQEDMQTDDIADWGKREFEEEVNYSGNLTFEPLGILNDDSNEVGLVHIGFVYVVYGDSESISIKDEHKSGALYSLAECETIFENMESWSKVCFTALKQKLS
jgi:predicted NUDIX family phosphoesterase